MSEVPTVWILGAGFSRSLGGPLLDDLLSMRNWHQYLQEDHKLAWSHDLCQGLILYHFGRNFPEGYLFLTQNDVPRGASWWNNAEEFLEHLSRLASEQPAISAQWKAVQAAFSRSSRGAFKGIDQEFNVQRVSAAVTRFVAWQCRVTQRNCPSQVDNWERATPYRDWGKLLDQNDTLISFNYDTVIEDIACPNVEVALPQYEDRPEPKNPQDLKVPLLLKLHGSVDWQDQDGQIFRTPGHQHIPVIATPGDAKYNFRRGRFRQLWDTAHDSIVKAQKIAWIGYSLPPSDASAVDLLLSAVGSNPLNGLRIDIVLGSNSREASRIEEMLQVVLSQRPRPTLEENAAVMRERLAELETIEPDLVRARRVINKQLVMGIVGESERLQAFYRDELGATKFGNYLGAMPNDELIGEARVRELYAQDYLRLFATSEAQRANLLQSRNQWSDAKAKLIEFKEKIESSLRGSD